MKDKRLPIYFSDEALQILTAVQGKHGDNELSLSGAVNLVTQALMLCTHNAIPLSAKELLACCQALTEGAGLTGDQRPTHDALKGALDDMRDALFQDVSAPGIVEDWDIHPQRLINRLSIMSVVELMALAIASRQYWRGFALPNIRPPAECADYTGWAEQWVKG